VDCGAVEIGMSVQELNLEQARQKMAAKQDESWARFSSRPW
jgi:hypothetical protein